jgi:hypothetical protein
MVIDTFIIYESLEGLLCYYIIGGVGISMSLRHKGLSVVEIKGPVTPVFYNIGVSIMHKKIRGKLNKFVGPVAFFQGIVAFFRE